MEQSAVPNATSRRFHRMDCVLLVILILLDSWYLGHNAMQVYDFFDMSAFMDAGYRVYRGQSPYTDFFYLAGPVHLYLHALSFWLFGFTKTAVLAHMLVVNAIVVGLTYAIARRHLSLVESAVLTLLTCFCFYGPISHPWYDQNAHFFVILGVALVEFQLPFVNERKAFLTGLGCGICVALSFLTKHNIGAAGFGFLGFLFCVAPLRKKTWIGFLLGFLGAMVAILLTLKSSQDYFYDNFLAFHTSSRLKDFEKLFFICSRMPYTYLLAVGCVALGLGGWVSFKNERERWVLLAGLLATSVFAAWTGSMMVPANIPLLGLDLTYLLILARKLPQGTQDPRKLWSYRGVVAVVAICILYGIRISFQRSQWQLVWRWHPSNHRNNYEFQTASFRGWRCNREIGEGVDRAVDYINQNVPPQDSLIVMPDATLIYGMTGRESYRGAPFIFDIGNSPPPGDIYDKFRADFIHHPPQWIMLRIENEITIANTRNLILWLQLDQFIFNNYLQVWQWGDYHLLRYSPPTPSPTPPTTQPPA